MNYQKADMEDLLKDEFFVRWVQSPDAESDRFWRQWLAQHPEKRETVLAARQFLQSLAYKQRYALSEEDRLELATRIFAGAEESGPQVRRMDGSWWGRVAASVAVLLLAGVLTWWQWPEQQEVVAVLQPDAWQVRAVPAGQKLSLTLPDGTHIKLNANTVLAFPQAFSDSLRVVEVRKGEAFFEVAEDAAKPFVVRTGTTQTRVLGTTFNVRYQAEVEQVEVALVSGKVRYTAEDTELILAPSEMVRTNARGTQKSNFDLLAVTGWKDGKIVFDNTPIEEVLNVLENWYGVEIEVDNNLKNKATYTGVFENQTLESVLIGLGFSTQSKIRQKM